MQNEEMNPVLTGQEPTEEIKKPKKEKVDKEKVDDTYEKMMYSPSSSEADPTVEINKTTDEGHKTLRPQAEELLELLEKGEGALSDKYSKALLDLALKDPTAVTVKTPRGRMTVKDAIGEGFDLTTGDFTNEAIPKVDWQGEISKLDPREQETIRKLTTPGTRQAGPSSMPEGGDVIPGPTGEPIPEQATGQPINDVGAMGPSQMEGTELPLGGV